MTDVERKHFPSSWIECPLGDVLLDIVGGGTPSKGVEAYFQGHIPLMTVKDMKQRRPNGTGFNITEEALANSSARMIPADTVIIATRMGLGKVVRASFDTAINQDLKALFAPPELDKSYLEFWLMSVASKIESMGTGTTVKGVRLNAVRSLEFPLAPLNEQRRIVEKIETLFARLDKGEEAVREVQKLLTRYRQSVLKSAVTGQLTADWRAQRQGALVSGKELLAGNLETRRENWEGSGKYKEPFLPDVSDLHALPEEWAWMSLDALGPISTGATPPTAQKDKFYGGDVAFLKPTDLDQGFIVQGCREWLTDEGAAKSRLVRSGDVMVTSIGATTGKTGVCRFEKAAFNQQINAVSPIKDIILGDLLYWFVIETGFQNRLWNNAAATTLPIINKSKFSRLPVPCPPDDEQPEMLSRIIEHMEKADVLDAWCETELKRSATLRQSILKDAFAGKLVPQDPTDEPASALLARIQAERLAKLPKTRKQKAKV